MNIRYLLFLLVAFQFSQGQQFPIDFEDTFTSFTGFSGSSFSKRTDPIMATNNVGQFFNDGGQATQGFFVDLNTAVNLGANQNVTLRFFAFDPNSHNILVKLERGTQPPVEVLRQVSGAANTWVDLTFNFANATQSGTANTLSATGQYNRVAIFIDFGLTVAGTYLLDDINNGATATPPNPIDVVYNDLVWSDEFDTPGTNNPIDATKWFHQTQIPAGGSWFNGEQQHYTNRLANSYVENGNLHIVAKRESFRDQNVTKQFTSARLNSKFAFTYGRVDVRAKLPLGAGTWPAIWTLGKNVNEAGGFWQPQFGTTNWPFCGEIDVMEHGLGALNHVSAALHTPSSFGNTQNVRERILTDVANTFYVYSMNWSPNQITFLIDDVPFYIYNPPVKNADTYPFNADQYMLLNVAMGGIAGAIDPNFTQSAMVIDYVRVYQNAPLSTPGAAATVNLRMYPNPTNGMLQFTAAQPIDNVWIYDLQGKLVQAASQNIESIDVSALARGMYLVKVQLGAQTLTEKLIKE